jgi:hypothetical protein
VTRHKKTKEGEMILKRYFKSKKLKGNLKKRKRDRKKEQRLSSSKIGEEKIK